MRFTFRLLSAAVLLALPLIARADGALRGRITDDQGNPLPGAVIKAKGPQGIRSTIADSHGYYNLYGLTPGRYEVLTDLEGYSSQLDRYLIREGLTRREDHQLAASDDRFIFTREIYIDPYSANSSVNLTREELEPFAIGRLLSDWVDAVSP